MMTTTTSMFLLLLPPLVCVATTGGTSPMTTMRQAEDPPYFTRDVTHRDAAGNGKIIGEMGSSSGRAFYYYNGTAMVNTTTVAITMAFYSVIALGIYSLIANAAAEQMTPFIDGAQSINSTANAFKAAAGLVLNGIDKKDEKAPLHLTPDTIAERRHDDDENEDYDDEDDEYYEDYEDYEEVEEEDEEDEKRYLNEYQQYLKQYEKWSVKYGGKSAPPPQPPVVSEFKGRKKGKMSAKKRRQRR